MKVLNASFWLVWLFGAQRQHRTGEQNAALNCTWHMLKAVRSFTTTDSVAQLLACSLLAAKVGRLLWDCCDLLSQIAMRVCIGFCARLSSLRQKVNHRMQRLGCWELQLDGF